MPPLGLFCCYVKCGFSVLGHFVSFKQFLFIPCTCAHVTEAILAYGHILNHVLETCLGIFSLAYAHTAFKHMLIQLHMALKHASCCKTTEQFRGNLCNSHLQTKLNVLFIWLFATLCLESIAILISIYKVNIISRNRKRNWLMFAFLNKYTYIQVKVMDRDLMSEEDIEVF